MIKFELLKDTKLTDYSCYNELEEELKKSAEQLDQCYNKDGLYKDVDDPYKLIDKLQPMSLIFNAYPKQMFTYAAIVDEKELSSVCKALDGGYDNFSYKVTDYISNLPNTDDLETRYKEAYWCKWMQYIEVISMWLKDQCKLADVLQMRQQFVDLAQERLKNTIWEA